MLDAKTEKAGNSINDNSKKHLEYLDKADVAVYPLYIWLHMQLILFADNVSSYICFL